ncbi:SPOR domain-containing protein [Flavobacterium cellulosilyticum]|uniref:SPOR domain-containing protein n=1 Tax=Flavobacterium cellulosilyticum TaxID=2541731 RepID=A0A4R5C9L8_9FLAO|nr:SPOR domain-containing protein [Flavobacterium cellulosilyticum]TDD96548.1 SPOR domain-containing protein [Flavobacterium cellulosilyticum]
MRTLKTQESIFIFLLFSLLPCHLFAQDESNNLIQDPKFEQLLNEKRKINTSLTINDSYKIQIFNGSNDNAIKILNEFKQENKDLDATIIFNTPNYKVWVGNFKTRIEAERYLIDIKKNYNSVFLIKPGK